MADTANSGSSGSPPLFPELLLPLSLKNICMLHVLFRVEEFPVESLSLLPRAIRERLFRGLSRADILHLGGTAVFSDLEEHEHHLSHYLLSFRENLLDVILFGDARGFICICDLKFCILDGPVKLESYYKLICKTNSFASLGASLVLFKPAFPSSMIVPKHLQRFLNMQDYSHSRLEKLAWSLLHYCNVHCAPKQLKIDCCTFLNSMFWKDFEDAYENKQNHPDQDQIDVTMNPVIPFIQEFLSSVEVLDLVMICNCTCMNHSSKSSHMVAYVLLYNIITSRQPCLKRFNLLGILMVIERIIKAIFALVCTVESKFFPCMVDSNYWNVGVSFTFEPKLIQLKSLSIWSSYIMLSGSNPSRDHTLVAYISQSIVTNQMKSLSSVGLEICYSDSALFNSLNELLKQPQFQVLYIKKYPFQGACELIVTFLTTPTSHEQLLAIEDNEERSLIKSCKETDGDENEIDSESRKKIAIQSNSLTPNSLHASQPLPDTNVQHKCLDLGRSSSSLLYSWLFSLPELKLKKLMLTPDMALVSADKVIQVEHVVYQARYKPNMPTIKFAHLEKLVVTNPVLKRLVVQDGRVIAGLLPALNHCLSVLYQQGRGLEEIILSSVQFDDVDDTKEFFILVRDLSHSYGTTLVVSSENNRLIDNRWQKVIGSLSKQFQEKKIKKIIYKALNSKGHSVLKLLTEELVLHLTCVNFTKHSSSTSKHICIHDLC